MQKINIRNLFRLGKQNKIRPLHFILANRSKEKLGEIDNVFDISYHPQLQTSELSFTVYKKADSKSCRLWDEIIPRRLLWVKEYGEWFEISVDIDESEKISKKIITATALCQSELSQIKMNSTEINTESDISRPDYEVSTFYNPDNIKASILHRVLEKVPNYSIKHVDTTLQKIQRSFSISNDTYIYDFLTGTLQEEIGCLFLFDFNERGIYVYDMETACLDCDYRDETEFTVCPKCGKTNIHKPYGDDTSIFVSKDNLGENIKLTSTANEVKNCFKVTGGDEFINAAVINSNPNGTDTIYVFDEDTKYDMPDELVAKLNEYDALLEEYRTTREYSIPDDVVNECNKLIGKINSIYPDKFSAINSSYPGYSNISKLYYDTFDLQLFLESSMMPTWEQNDKTAWSQVDLVEKELKTVSLKDVSNISKSTADNAVLLMVKAIIDTNIYKAEVINSSFVSQTWTGQVKLTNYSKAEDTAASKVLTVVIDDNIVSFIEQRLQKSTAKIDTIGIKELFSIDDFDLFKAELKKYCLASLKGFSNAYQTVLDVLVEERVSDTESEFYNDFYVPYYNKLGAIEAEISVRDMDIDVVNKLQNELQNIIAGTHEALNFEKYLGTDLWNTFLSYRREDKYSNENYISNGLNNEQLITKAQELIDVAYKELTKSSTKQYTITGTLHNLLLIVDEDGNQVFKPILDDFTLGNFIRCKIDGVIYRMRIMDVTINYTDLKSLSITFGDVSKNKNIINKMSDVIKQTNSIAGSFSTIKKQAKQGEKADYTIEKLRKEGLDSAQCNIFNTNSTFIMDNHGLLGRNYDDVTDQFSDEWVRINGSNIIFSNDGGKSTKFAIGKQKYALNGTQYEEYGVNTDFVLGGKIIGGDIYSANYANDGNGNIVGNHFDLLGSNFELADGNIIYDKSKNKLSFKNVTMQWSTVNNLSISDVNELDKTLETTQKAIESLDEQAAKYLGLTAETLIGNNYVISPTIVGGYLDIINADNGNRVIIDPNNLTQNDYIFQIHNGTKISVGIKKDGEAFFEGDITATSLTLNSDNASISKEGLLEAKNAIIYGTIYANNGYFTGEIKSGSTITCGNNFSVDQNGILTCSNANITGSISSNSATINGGTIGGWKITETDIYNDFGDNSAGIGSYGGRFAFWAGASFDNFSEANFRVDHSGNLYAANVDLKGKIEATGGKIGKWTITDECLKGGKGETTAGLGAEMAFYAGNEISKDAPFHVGYDGSLYASKGKIGKFVIDEGYLECGSGTSAAGLGATMAFYAGNVTSRIAPFHVDYDGSLYASKGSIGGWCIEDDWLKGTDSQGRTFISPNGTAGFFCIDSEKMKQAEFNISPGRIYISPGDSGELILWGYSFTSKMIEELFNNLSH